MKRQVMIPRQQSLITPEILNPFVHRIHLTLYQKVQIALMSVFVVPLRLLAAFTCLLIAWLLAKISLAFRPKDEFDQPLTGWRNMLRPVIVFFSQAMFLMGGFWISTKGKLSSCKEGPIIALAPHSSYFDSIVVVYLNLTTIVAKSTSANIPIFNTLIEFTQPLYVKREDPNSRKNIMKEMTRRAKTMGEWPPILIFPEGTCTNRTCLIGFKQGAFYPGVPVQPLCIRYKNALDTYTWTWEGPGAFTCLWLSLCQLNNKIEVEFLPVYNPSEEEKQDPTLYAANVRNEMAKCLKVPVTDHSYNDVRLMRKAAQLNLPRTTGLVEIQKLHTKLGINFDRVNELLDHFSNIPTKDKGKITLEEFAAYLHVPVSPALEEIFALYDRNGSNTIDFREYIIGLSLISIPANNEDTIRLAFELFDSDKNGYITEEELKEILVNAFGMDNLDVETLFKKIDTSNDGKITFDKFKAYALSNPEYAKLFMTYQELKTLCENGNDTNESESI